MTKSDIAEIKEFALAMASGAVALCAVVLMLPYYLCTEIIRAAEVAAVVTSDLAKDKRKVAEQELIEVLERRQERAERIKAIQERSEV